MFDWRIPYLFCRSDTYIALLLGPICMASVAKWGLFRGRHGLMAEVTYAILWPLSFPIWAGFVYADGISLSISPFIALAYGAGFALAAVRRSRMPVERAIAGILVAANVLFILIASAAAI